MSEDDPRMDGKPAGRPPQHAPGATRPDEARADEAGTDVLGPDGAEPTDEHSVGGILQRVRDAGEGPDVRVSQVVEALGRASFAPLLLVPALVVVTPLSGIPGLSSVCGITIALIAMQMAIGRRHIWLPGWIMRRRVERRRYNSAIDWLARPARWIDAVTRQRLTLLVRRPFVLIPQLLSLISGAAMPFLEFVPFTSSILGAGVAFFTVSMVARDGLITLLGLVVVGSAATAVYGLVGPV